jgi:hypothetical protein
VQPGFSVTRDDSGVIVVSITNNCGDKALVDQEQCDLGTNPDTGANLNTQGSGCFNCQLEQGYYASKTIIGGV